MAKKDGEEKSDGFDSIKDALSKHLGEDHEDVKALTPENASATMCKHFCAMSKAHALASKAKDAAEAIAASKTAELAVALSKIPAQTEMPSALMLSYAAKAGESTFDNLAKAGCITPKVRDGLKALVVGAPGARNAFALSITTEAEESFADKLGKVLADNTPVLLGEHTKAQTIALSREIPGGGETKDFDEKVNKEMIAAANKGR